MLGMNMKDKIEQWRGWATTVAVVVQLAVMLVKGGAVVGKVEEHDRRINNLELIGSSRLQVHERMDDERVTELKAQIARLVAITDKQSEIQSDVKVIRATMQADAVATQAALSTLREQILLIADLKKSASGGVKP